MILNFFQTLKDWATILFEKISWTNVLTFITGIVFGIILSGLVYLVLLMISIKKQEKTIVKCQNEVDDEQIQKAIIAAKNIYNEEASHQDTNDKLIAIKNISWDLIQDIAKLHYPEAKYPIYELSVDELLMLNHYITSRIESIFDGKILRLGKKLKLSTIVNALETKKKIDENKLIKAAQVATRSKPVKVIMGIANFVNPKYWASKLMSSTIIPATMNKIATLIIEIVGQETRRVYSKNAFSENEPNTVIQKKAEELEQNLESELK